MYTQTSILKYKTYCDKKNKYIKVQNIYHLVYDENNNIREQNLIKYITYVMIHLTNNKVDFYVNSMEEFLKNISYLDLYIVKEYMYEKYRENKYNLSKENPRIVIKFDYSYLYEKIFDLYLRQDPLAYKRNEFIKSIETITADINADINANDNPENDNYKNNLMCLIDPNIFWLQELTSYL